jgi:HK97 family phage portal protein
MRFAFEVRRSEKRSEYPESSVGAFVKWIFSGGNTKTKSGVTVDQETALKFSVVFSCFRILGETIGSLPLNIYRINTDGSKSIAFDHPLQQLLKTKPNQIMTSFIWRELMMSHLNGWGNHFSEIKRNGGYKVKGFEPIL